jgi:cytochrome P450 family 6
MSYCLYELALNKDIQTKLREQIKLMMNENDGKLTYDGIKNIKYLDMIING